MIRKLALVVEDHPSNLLLVKDILEADGFDVVCATNAEEACRLADACTPAIALVDIQIPSGGGERVLAYFRGIERLARVPIIAVTAYALNGDRERFLAEDFNGYVSKPIDVAGFVRTVHLHVDPMPL
ncbi:MAG: response regulator [Pseudomonadota bacterium]|nr:response regulator [Pseudomonadota bacterium]